jgi:hypothetical protein
VSKGLDYLGMVYLRLGCTTPMLDSFFGLSKYLQLFDRAWC